MKYVGLDLGTKTGWAVLHADGTRSASGVWDCSIKSGESSGFRFIRFRSAFASLLAAYSDILAGYEDVKRHRGTAAAHIYGGLKGHMLEMLDSLDVPYTGVGVGEVKRAATNNGRASKDDMIAAAESQWGVEMHDDNEADALWIAEAVRRIKMDGGMR